MKKFTLIDYHFEIEINKDYCEIISIIPGKNFNDLFNNIQRYQNNIQVYTFITAIQNLLDTNLAQINVNNIKIENKNLINFDNDIIEILNLHQKSDFFIELKDRGLIGKPNFRIEYTIKPNQNLEIIGCFAIFNNQLFLLNKYLFELFSTINHINNETQNINTKYNHWEDIAKIKNLSTFTNTVISGFISKEKIIIPSTMNLDFKEDLNKNLELIVSLCGLTKEEERLFKNRFDDLINVENSYSFNLNNTKTRIVLTPEIQSNLEIIKQIPKKIRRIQDKKEIIKNPTSFLKYPEVVSLSDYSERVIDFGLYKEVFNENRSSNIKWGYPINLELTDLNNETFFVKLESKEEAKHLKEELKQAIDENNPYISLFNKDIPLNIRNLEEFKDFHLHCDIENEQNNKQVKYIELENNNGEKLEIQIDKDLISNLREQLKEKPIELKIENQLIPINTNNVKKLYKAFEIHLIIEEGNEENQSFFTEELLNTYWRNNKVELPKALKKEFETFNNQKEPLKLESHQKVGLAWLQNSYRLRELGRNGVLLADDMGLGKTIQILSFIFWLKEHISNKHPNKPILIVAPVILLENWKNEYYKFFETTLGEPLILHGNQIKNFRRDNDKEFIGKEYYQITEKNGAPKSYLDIDEIKKHDIVITNYDTLVNYEFSLGKIDWLLAILDEAQEIKEEKSYKSRVAKSLKADFKIAATGTPVENSLTDLWNIFNFLQPNLLGTKKEFIKEFKEKEMTEEKYKKLQNKFYYKKPYAFILRRMKDKTLKDCLPCKHIKIYKTPLSDTQIEKYNYLKKLIHTETPLGVLQQMNRFAQHPRLINPERTFDKTTLIEESSKLQKLIEILHNIKLKNEKVIIFCMLHEIQTYLKKILEEEFNIENIDIINGCANTTTSRQKRIDKFQSNDNEFNIIILSPVAAGVGLNITGANHVIHYGRWWNPAKENQATDRVYRIGQKKEVFVHYLIDTILNSNDSTFDENLHELISKKNEVAKNFLVPNDTDLAHLLLDKYINDNTLINTEINITNINKLTPEDFEALAGCYFQQLGYKIYLCQNCCLGMDLIAYNNQEINIIQCKHTASNLIQDDTAIHNVLNAKDKYFYNKFTNKILTLTCFTNSQFNDFAHELAIAHNIRLIENTDLINFKTNKQELLKQYSKKLQHEDQLKNIIESEIYAI